MKTLEIFQEFEKRAIAFGNEHNRFQIGDIVETTLIGNKKPRLLRLSKIEVVVGRWAQKTTYKSLSLVYFGRRLRKDLSPLDYVGSGLWLQTFTRVSDGAKFEGNFNGVNDWISDCGLTFGIAAEAEAREKYPQAYKTYANAAADYPYEF